MQHYKNIFATVGSLIILIAIFFGFRWFIIQNGTNVEVTPSTQLAQVAAPTSGLVGYWPFDSGSTDSSGNGNNGNQIGSPSVATGKINGALSFNGSSSYVKVPFSPAFDFSTTGGFTTTAWIKLNSISSLAFIVQ